MKLNRLAFCCLCLLALISCKEKQPKIPAYNADYSAYINSFTSGVISKKANIQINFASALADSTNLGHTLDADLLQFDPPITGQLSFAGQYTLSFVPTENLKPGQVYTARLALAKLMDVPDSLASFGFGFQVLRPDYEWGAVQLQASPETQMDWYRVEGTLLSADEEDLGDVKEILSAQVDGKKVALTWRTGDLPRQYVFELDSIQRGDSRRPISLKVNKDRPGAEKLEDKSLTLPALGEFEYLGHSIANAPSQHIRLNFSDPLEPGQNLSGLITVQGQDELRFEIENTSILIYPSENLFGSKTVSIFPGIKNIQGYKFKEQKQLRLEFLNEKPQVKIPGDGNIIPIGEKLLMPFQAISLSAVDVKVVKIPETNVIQFLQTNDYDGDQELYRVGELVASKKVELKPRGSLKDWNTYSIDVSKLVEPEPGAIYRVYLSFTKAYSVYGCSEEVEVENEEEEDYWYYDDYYYYQSGDASAYDRNDYYFSYPRGYTWRQRDNACHVSYYNSERFATRNLLATNLGLIVKRTEDGLLDFTVNDLVENKPVSGASITIYNYQGRELGQVKTGSEGWAQMPVKGRPYFAVATKGNHRTYLKLNEGLALSLSEFEVAGQQVAEGVKGFIYGERGVWRPGDTLFLNFILEDDQNRLPQKHPIHFELVDGRGLVVDRQIKYKGESRIYPFTTRTSGSAVTGSYRAVVRIGDRQFTERIRIETVKPNRLKVELDFARKTILADGTKPKAKLAVNWLTGIPAANAKVDITAEFKQDHQAFKAFSKYSFNDPVRQFATFEKKVFEGTVGEEGTANIELDISKQNNAPSMLSARFVVKAFEGGGDFSTEYFDAPVAPYQRFVGLKMPVAKEGHFLQTDQDYELKIKTVDEQGQPISMEGLEVKVYRIDWYWWYNSQNENLARFVNNEVNHLVSEGRVSTYNGDGSYKLRVNYPRWGRFLVRVCDPKGGHCSGQITYFDWPAGKSGDRPELAGATMLSFSTEKERYSLGEEIVASIPADKASRVLVTVENGSGILKKEWLEPKDGKVEYRLKATADMAPNVYISAMLLQPHAQTENDRPMRLYGVVPVEVYDAKTRLVPQIEAREVWRPESKVTVKVKEKNGRDMHYTLAIVDDGLLDLTRFKTPDPWNHFYAKEALGVKTWDMYNDVLGAYGGRLEQVFAIGGDEALNKMENSNLNRFKPMVRSLGPFKLKAGETATHNIKLPNYVGSVRVMVVAADEARAYGSAEKSVKVRKPLMVLTTLPRILSPGDEVTVPVTVFAMEEQVRDVSLSLSVNGKVTVMGEKDKKVSFTKNGEKVVDFKLKVPEDIGEAKVRIDASSGREKAYDETHLRVRLPNPPQSQLVSFFLKPGQDTSLEYQPIGVEGTNSLQVEASTMPPINLSDRLHFLFGYPHHCTEQTVSVAFPGLYLEEMMSLSDDMKQVRDQNTGIALQTIYERQASNGGIRYWPGSSHVDPYVTSYAGHFMMVAKDRGYQIAAGSLARWKKYQQGAARNWRPDYVNGYSRNALEQAYRLYTLALEGSPEVGAMNRFRETRNLSATSLWLLSASYLKAGQKEAAASEADKVGPVERSSYYGYWYYGDELRNQAFKLMVLHELGRENQALETARQMAKDLNGNHQYGTHSLAFALMSVLSTYGDNARGGKMLWTYRAEGEQYRHEEPYTYDLYHAKKQENQKFGYTLTNEGKVPVNFVVTRTGTPIDYDIPAVSSNLSMDVRYQYPNGKELDVDRIKQGQDFVAVVTISRPSASEGYQNMALSQLLPSGWEIINTRLLEVSGESESAYDYRDIRDDRVYTYFDLRNNYSRTGNGYSVTYRLRLNATYAGRYFLPPVECVDMYDNEIKARVAGKWVEVVR